MRAAESWFSFSLSFSKKFLTASTKLALGDVQTSRNHVLGAVKMVNLNGGPRLLGVGGFLWYLLQNFVQRKGGFAGAPELSAKT